MECESCAYFCYDDEYEQEICTLQLDEDEYERFMSTSHKKCPYYKFYDEYKMVHKQI